MNTLVFAVQIKTRRAGNASTVLKVDTIQYLKINLIRFFLNENTISIQQTISFIAFSAGTIKLVVIFAKIVDFYASTKTKIKAFITL